MKELSLNLGDWLNVAFNIVFLVVAWYVIRRIGRSNQKAVDSLHEARVFLRDSISPEGAPIMYGLTRRLTFGDAVTAEIVYECDTYQVWEIQLKAGASFPPHKHLHGHETHIPISGKYQVAQTFDGKVVVTEVDRSSCDDCKPIPVFIQCDTSHTVTALTDCVYMSVVIPPIEFASLRDMD